MGSLDKILLTGANGFLGSEILNELIAEGYSPIILIRKTSNLWRIENLLSNCEVFILDEGMTNLKTVFEENKIKGIIHTATDYGRDQSLINILKVNVLLPIEMIEYGIGNGLETFVNADTFFAKPEFQQSYLSNYTESKRILERLLLTLSEHLNVRNIRLEHIYGERDSEAKFVTTIFNKLINNEPEILLTEGTQKRDFIYVKDAAKAFIKVLKNTTNKKKYCEFQVGNGQSISVRTFVEQMAEITESKSSLKFGALPARTGEIEDSFANTATLNEIGWKPNYSISQAVNNMIIRQKK